MKRKRETTQELVKKIFNRIKEDYSEVASKIDYMIADNDYEYITNDDFDILALPSKGGSEGWYTDIYIRGSWDQNDEKTREHHVGTCKTLDEGAEGAMLIGQLSGLVEYFTVKILWEENDLYSTDSWLDRKENEMKNKEIIAKAAVNAGMYTSDEVNEMITKGIDIPLHTYRGWNKKGRYKIKEGAKPIKVKLWQKIEESGKFYLSESNLYTKEQMEKNSIKG